MTLPTDSERFSRALQSAILWPIGIIFLTALLLLLFTFELFQVVKLSDHSYRVLAETRTCENLIISSQDDVRGYLLTGDPDFVKTYDDNRGQIDERFAQLKALVQKNPEQVIRVEALIQAKDTWFEHAKTMVSHRSQDITVNADWVRMGKTMTDDILSKFEKINDIEVAQRDTRLYRIGKMKQALAYGGGGLVILLALTIAHVVRKQMMVLAASYRTALDTIEQRHSALARSEADLEEQKEWLRVTLTSIGDGVIVTDPSGRVLLMNHESERLTGWSNVEALHQQLSTVLRIVDEKTRLPVESPAARVMSEKKVAGPAKRSLLLSRTGEVRPIEDTTAPICDAKGNTLGLVMVFHDATDKRLA